MDLPGSRRAFVKTLGLGATALSLPVTAASKNALPRWRGFNLLYLFQARRQTGGPVEIPEDDFRMIADLGFDFVRIPMDYWFWIDSDWRATGRPAVQDLLKVREAGLVPVDRIIELGRKYGLHVSLNFHRAPGYCINEADLEPCVLWRDKDAEDAFVFHWELFARRYRDIGPNDLSFNLVNEAPRPRPRYMTREDYRRVMTRTADTIREITPDRLIIIDGLSVGNEVVYEMMPTRVAQSVHAYSPAEVSHYRAGWVDKRRDFPAPWWPAVRRDGSGLVSRETLEAHYEPWGWLVRQGIGVHCGEAGGFNKISHDVFLRWICDVLDILKSHNIGWALWNFRGSFGVLDSGREDVAYADWHGHKLDNKLLTLLQYH
ncbi:MAG TPA: cellulase family glycosylhydrolase [Bryobacteraceae bacterium]|nr:cellulase family glycosylhydrolase [Bryobacteraceae bacterium]